MRQMDEMMTAMTGDPMLGIGRGFPSLMGPNPMQQALVPMNPQRGVRRRSDPFSPFAMPGMNLMSQMVTFLLTKRILSSVLISGKTYLLIFQCTCLIN